MPMSEHCKKKTFIYKKKSVNTIEKKIMCRKRGQNIVSGDNKGTTSRFFRKPSLYNKTFESIIMVTENTVMLTSESDNKIQGNEPKENACQRVKTCVITVVSAYIKPSI